MTATTVSIAMATYNGARFLRPQLDSLAAQDHHPAELVITDDGSSDETHAIVRDFATTAPFPVHFHLNTARLGFRGNFIRAAGLCRSSLVAYCDQDDIWHRNKLSTVVALFDAEPDILMVHHNANILTSADRHGGLLAPQDRHPPCFAPLAAHPWLVSHGFTQTFRRELLAFQDLWEQSTDANAPDERMTHDQWYLFLASVFGRIQWIESPLAEYRQHGGNTYGWFEESLGRRLHLWLEDRSGVYVRCRAAANRRAQILDIGLQRLGRADWRDRAAIASSRYRTLAKLYEARIQVYRASGPAKRLAAFRGLYAANAYNCRGDWTFHATRGGVKDFVLGVIAGPMLNRFGYPPAWGDPTCAAIVHG